MHLDLLDLAPIGLLLMVIISLFSARRQVRALQSEEARLLKADNAAPPAEVKPSNFTNGSANASQSTQVAAAHRRRCLADTRADLAHLAMIEKRAWRMLIPCGILLMIMLFI